jgi:hypothetical protein
VLQHLMLHTYAFCDSAEVFVCLGGYASAAAYAGAYKKRPNGRPNPLLETLLGDLPCLPADSAAYAIVRRNPPIGAPEPPYGRANSLADVLLSPVKRSLRNRNLKTPTVPIKRPPDVVLFALSVPFPVPLARRSPLATIAISLTIWTLSTSVARLFAIDDVSDWAFTPLPDN